MEVDKVIVMNRSALEEKYGARRERIEKALGRLSAAAEFLLIL